MTTGEGEVKQLSLIGWGREGEKTQEITVMGFLPLPPMGHGSCAVCMRSHQHGPATPKHDPKPRTKSGAMALPAPNETAHFPGFSLLFHEREMSLFFANIVTYRTKYLDDRNI